MVYSTTLILHIVAGYLALVSGAFIFMTQKGTGRHRRVGKIFHYSMYIIVVTALILAVVKKMPFLFHVAVFVFYQNLAGFRSVRFPLLRPAVIDWFVLILALGNAVFMLASGNPVLLVFGGISMALIAGDIRNYYRILWQKQSLHKKTWLKRHIGMMVGAYIGTFTAFLVVNATVSRACSFLLWIGPTLVFVPLIWYWTRKYAGDTPVRKTIPGAGTKIHFVILLLMPVLENFAQPYVDGGKTRHRFAQLNLGTDMRFWHNAGTHESHFKTTGAVAQNQLPAFSEYRLIIGGTHFWGHADFQVAVPVFSWQYRGLRTGPETSARYFPLEIRHRRLRPFLGMSWLPVTFRQPGATTLTRHTFPFVAGALFSHRRNLLSLEAGYSHQNKLRYYISENTTASVQLHSVYIALSYKLMLETTQSAEKNWQSGRTSWLTDTLAERGELNGFTFAAGPSSAIFLRKFRRNTSELPFLGQHKTVPVFAEVGIGYYLHNYDMQFSAVFRGNSSKLEAFGYRQCAQRRALSLETYKFLADYHGFAVFAGLGIGAEALKVYESRPGEDEKIASVNICRPGLIAGWDIRPDRLQAWYLRTVLRWFPGLGVEMAGGGIFYFDQLEINFIQLVVFPGRLF